MKQNESFTRLIQEKFLPQNIYCLGKANDSSYQ